MLIGIFKEENPLQTLPRERIDLYLEIAHRKGFEVAFFDEKSILTKSKKIKGLVYENNLWFQKNLEYPNYIINESELSISELPPKIKSLRETIIFNTFGIERYSQILRKLKKLDNFNNFLPNYCYLSNTKRFVELLSTTSSLLIRSIYGKTVYVLKEISDSEIEINDLKNSKIVSKIDLFLNMPEIIGKEKMYIAMEDITNFLEKDERVLVHLLLNQQNEFEVFMKTPIVEGNLVPLKDFMTNKQGDLNYLTYLLENLSKDFAKEINSFYKQTRREIVLELAIHNGNFVLYNAYTKNTLPYDEEYRISHIFQWIKQQEEIQIMSRKISIGMLVGSVKNSGRFRKFNNMRFACSGVAKIKGNDFFFFRPEDVDLEKKLINGFYYNKEGEYSRKKYNYPDVIIDRLRRRGLEEYKHIYTEFNNIPFNNIRDGGSLDKSDIYRIVSGSPIFSEVLIPYKDINTLQDILEFIDAQEKIILKPTIASFGDGVVSIFKRKENDYLVRPGNIEKYDMNFAQLIEYLKNYMTECSGIVVQKFIESKTAQGAPFDIRMHVLKDAKNQWNIANIYPRLGRVGGVTSNLSGGGSTTSWIKFFNDQFSDFNYSLVNEEIRNFAISFADFFQEELQTPLNEIAIDIGIDRETVQVYLFEANVNKPGCRNHVLEAAFYIVAYAEYLAKENIKYEINKGENNESNIGKKISNFSY